MWIRLLTVDETISKHQETIVNPPHHFTEKYINSVLSKNYSGRKKRNQENIHLFHRAIFFCEKIDQIFHTIGENMRNRKHKRCNVWFCLHRQLALRQTFQGPASSRSSEIFQYIWWGIFENSNFWNCHSLSEKLRGIEENWGAITLGVPWRADLSRRTEWVIYKGGVHEAKPNAESAFPSCSYSLGLSGVNRAYLGFAPESEDKC